MCNDTLRIIKKESQHPALRNRRRYICLLNNTLIARKIKEAKEMNSLFEI